MNIEKLPIKKLIEYKNNPRKNENAVNVVAESIRVFGFRNPILIDKDNVIIAGHTRLKAAQKLGIDTVPCIRIEDLTQEQIKGLRLADNKTGELADWDFSKLEIELYDIKNIDMELLGFDTTELDFADFDGAGDGGGSQIQNGDKVRVVIGALMFDIEDDDHSIYKKTKDADADIVQATLIDLINKGELL